MNVLLKRISISLLLMLGISGAFANPGHEREERESARPQQRSVDQGRRQEQFRQFNQARDNGGTPDDGSRKHGRMSAEERRALRQQINEAGQDIYVPRR